MHDVLFDRQEVWGALESEAQATETFAKYAEELQIDKPWFLETIQSEAIKQRVSQDLAAGNAVRVNATPTIFVNGEKLTAPQRLPSIVESKLNN